MKRAVRPTTVKENYFASGVLKDLIKVQNLPLIINSNYKCIFVYLYN